MDHSELVWIPQEILKQGLKHKYFIGHPKKHQIGIGFCQEQKGWRLHFQASSHCGQMEHNPVGKLWEMVSKIHLEVIYKRNEVAGVLTRPLLTLDTLGLLPKRADGVCSWTQTSVQGSVSGLITQVHLCLSMIPPPGKLQGKFLSRRLGLSRINSDFAMGSEVEKKGLWAGVQVSTAPV